MERQVTTSSNDQSKKLLFTILKTVRKTTWGKYLRIFQMAANPEGATMNSMSQELGEKPQSIHRLLQKMTERQALTRIKRGAEFYYLLDPAISTEAIEAMLSAIADEKTVDSGSLLGLDDNSGDTESVAKDKDEVINQRQFDESKLEVSEDMDVQETLNDNMSDRTSHLEWKEKKLQIRMSKLPDFNPEWTPEAQKAWLDALAQISSID